jgi:molybdopterin/thiamine biosynthesis adenylyltransferase
MFKVNRIVVVGAGGAGSHLIPLLARFENCREDREQPVEFFIADGDNYSKGNMNRQQFASHALNRNKADAQVAALEDVYQNVNFYSLPFFIGKGNIDSIVEENTVVFSCVDNHACRRIISDRCKELNNVLMISGGNEEFDGNVQAFCRVDGENVTPPVEARHPEITEDRGDRSIMSCDELANLPSGRQVLFVNFLGVALMAMFYYMYLHEGHEKAGKTIEIYFDALSGAFRQVGNPLKASPTEQ